ncbi:hypothetical protein FFLO_04694 [Filobasidium floriforme]|uniref:Uncharacterized protein n=1 Tax=Filobasidium floriforme TaxID=5210 RepID=A0A8K0NS20_9TREE|nr:hypothetical protein FFLO_04694 [Filobasidium floriforme]
MGTTFSRPNNSQPQANETDSAFPEEDDGVVHHTDRTAGQLGRSEEEPQTAIETNGYRLPGFTDEAVSAGQDQYVEAGPSSPAFDGADFTSPHSTTGKRKKKSKAKSKAKRVHSATQERFSDQDEPSASKVARTIEADVKSEAAAIRSLGSIRRLRTTTEGSMSSLPAVSSTAQAVQPSSAREDGELSDEEQTPVIPAPTLASVPVSTLPLPVVSTNIPAAPRATTNRPHRGGHGWKHKEYKDRDALSTGQSVPWPTMPPYLASFRSFVPETSSRSRPKDTQSGLNYEYEYTASIAPVASGSQPQPVTTPQSDSPWPVSSYAGNRSTQVSGYGRRSHYTSPTSNTAAPQNFPVPPAFFRQYNAETSRRSGLVPPDSTQTAGAGPSTVNMPRNKNRTAEWDDDVDMEDRDAERALEENDAIRLEQARRWAEEQSMRMNQTLDAAGLRELIRLLLQLTSWGVSTTDFTERGVRRDLLRAVHDVASVTNPLQRPGSPPPPPPPVDSLPTPPPPPPSPPAQASRRQSIASSVEMDIATPSPEVQPITVNPSPSVEPIALPSVPDSLEAGPPTALAPEMAATSSKRLNHQNGLDTVQAALELVQVPTPSSETVSEPRPASDVTLMRAKLLAHKLRKQKEIKDRLRKLQAASTPTEISPEPLPNTNLPVPQPPSSETSASEAGSSFPSGERQANSVDVSPVQPLNVMLPKTPDLDNQTPIVTDSSQFFPVRAKAFGRGRKALAPAHPKSFIIDLDSDSDDDDAAAEQDRAVAVHQEAERLHAEHLKREIERKEADRAALEAKIALMEARRQAKKAQAALPPLRQNKSVYHQTVTITATLPEPAALPRGEAIVQDLTPSNITPSEPHELDKPALVEKMTPAASNVLDSHAAMTPRGETVAAIAGGSRDPASHTAMDMNVDQEHRSDEIKDMDKVVIFSSPLVASIPLFPDETDLEAPAALKPEVSAGKNRFQTQPTLSS